MIEDRGGVTALPLVGWLGEGAPHIVLKPGVATIGSSFKMASNPLLMEDICKKEEDGSSCVEDVGCPMLFGKDIVCGDGDGIALVPGPLGAC